MKSRYFATFRSNTSLSDKVMVFTGMLKQQVWEAMNKQYYEAFLTIYTEPELAIQLPQLYTKQNHWVEYGEPCILYKQNIETGEVDFNNILTTYPLNLPN